MIVAVIACGCSNASPYVCTASEQCLANGVQGVCEAQGFCSFPDAECPGGRRFEPNAGGGAGGACVDTDGGMPDAPACGELGMACCESGPACGGNGFCEAGTCRECVTSVVPGRHASCLIRHDKTVWCAGENQYGQLGFGLAGAPVSEWMQVRDSTGAVIADATSLGLGWESACAVRTAGAVWCWGLNSGGQLGDDTTSNRFLAVQVQTATGTPLTGVVEVGMGYSHACARDGAGVVSCWGSNDVGQLGSGTLVNRRRAAPVIGAGASGALELAVGGHHNCVRKAGDAVWCWGKNEHGELGDASIVNRSTPVMSGTGTSIGAGRSHTCGVRADGTLWCWGFTWRNRIGDGAAIVDPGADSRLSPVQVLTTPGGPPLAGVDKVVAAGVSCVLMRDTSVLCWGTGGHGQTGTNGGSTTPAPVITADGTRLTGIDRVVAKFPHVCAHRSSGEWLCWGRNTEGALGDGTFINRGVAMPLEFTCP